MDDAGTRRHHPEICKGFPAPAQHGVPLPVPFHFTLDITSQSVFITKKINLNGMVNNKISRDKGIHHVRIPSMTGNRSPKSRQINKRRHPGKILQNNASRHKRNRAWTIHVGTPGCQIVNILPAHHIRFSIAEQIFQQDADGIGKMVDIFVPVLLKSGQCIQGIGPAVDLKLPADIYFC